MFLFFCCIHASRKEKEIHAVINAYPHLYCERHLLKPVKTRKAVFYSDVFCRADDCSPNNFRIGIKHVVGLIGKNIDDYTVKGDQIYINIWNEADKKARNADIDILEIRETNGSISNDWAINAVLNVLKNDVSRPRDYVKNIPVIIRGSPPLTKNTLHIIENEFGGLKSPLQIKR